jgi:hypothetical protein
VRTFSFSEHMKEQGVLQRNERKRYSTKKVEMLSEPAG